MSLVELITTRMREMGVGRPALRSALEGVGVTVTRQALHTWLTGSGEPSDENLLGLLQVFAVPRAQWGDWFEAKAAGRRSRQAAA